MLQRICDLCGAKIGLPTSSTETTREYSDKYVKITKGGQNVFIGDVCDSCYKRIRDLVNAPKE